MRISNFLLYSGNTFETVSATNLHIIQQKMFKIATTGIKSSFYVDMRLTFQI